MKKILFFLLLGLVTRRETSAQSAEDSSYVIDYDFSALDTLKPIRTKTVAIILHTMEGYLTYDYDRVRDSALCHFAIWRGGKISNFIRADKVANGPGKSMLYSDTSIGDITINIEYEGFSEIYPTNGQLSPRIAKFLHDLQVEFNVHDSMVIIHPVVACFYPNMKKTPYPGHYARGRKSDAFFFATTPVREKLGLGPMMKYDMDVWEGRVIQNKAQAKRMGMHVYSDVEIAERVAYLQKVERRRLDSIEASQVQPITLCQADRISIGQPVYVLADPINRSTNQVDTVSTKKQFFSLSAFTLPRRLKLQR